MNAGDNPSYLLGLQVWPNRQTLRSFVSALALLVCCGCVQAQSWQADLPQAKLLGSADFRWFGMSIYSAKLWSESAPFTPDAKFALVLTYHLPLSRERFVNISLKEMRRIFATQLSPTQLRRFEQHMQTAFIDVASGEQLIGVNLPGQGCRFYSQHKLLAQIDDVEFAQAFFAIWFDPRTKDPEFARQLRGEQASPLSSKS